MSFVDRKQDPRRRANAIIAVGVIHAGLAYVVVTGLGAEIIRELGPPPLVGEQITLPPPPPDPTPTEQTRKPKEVAVHIPTTALPPLNPPDDWIPRPLPPETTETTLYPTGGESTDPPAPSLPRPTFTPKRAIPSNGSSGWISNDDYPRRALVDEAEGSAQYRLVIGTNGRVSTCELTRTTGNRALDDATCRLITSRARFESATDESGAKVMGTYTGSVRWEIPD
jgi:periplasmic protein TonB